MAMVGPEMMGAAKKLGPKVAGGFFKQAGRLLGQFFQGQVQDLSRFRDNAFILSAALQITGRLFASKQAVGAAKEPDDRDYRKLEFFKTSFRELGGFTLSYLVLRAIQRTTGFALKSYFGVSPLTKTMTSPFPSILKTVTGLGKMVINTLTGRPLPEVLPVSLAQQVQWRQKLGHIMVDPARAQRTAPFQSVINGVHKLFGGDSAAPAIDKLQSFLNYVPLLVSVVPTIALSGFWLERFSLKRAEAMYNQGKAKVSQKVHHVMDRLPVHHHRGGGAVRMESMPGGVGPFDGFQSSGASFPFVMPSAPNVMPVMMNNMPATPTPFWPQASQVRPMAPPMQPMSTQYYAPYNRTLYPY